MFGWVDGGASTRHPGIWDITYVHVPTSPSLIEFKLLIGGPAVTSCIEPRLDLFNLDAIYILIALLSGWIVGHYLR